MQTEHQPLASDVARGAALVWGTVTTAILMLFASLAVDLGRVMVARSELQAAADAAARAGAYNFQATLSPSSAVSAAVASASENRADTSSVTLDPNLDVQIGLWDETTRTFTPSPSRTPYDNAVRVTARRIASRNNATTLTFASLIGVNSIDIERSAIAIAPSPNSTTADVAGRSNAFSAGQPDNTFLYDPWGGESVGPSLAPTRLSAFPLRPGATMTFDATGSVTYHSPSGMWNGPEGNGGSAALMFPDNHPGMGDLIAPGMSLVAVFIDDNAPSTFAGARPPRLDFSTPAARNYTRLTPQLRQPFFIGTGTNPDGSKRSVVVPQGATRLFLGTMDSIAWRDNAGVFHVNIQQHGTVVTTR
jgi:Flp pilus assembly protein TadG